MERYLKQTQQHADYGDGVMESGDHSTNGASPKSLKSRRNFLLMPDAGGRRKTKRTMNGTMKFLSMALIVAITMLSLSGCSKDDDDNGDNAILTLTGLEGVNFISECIYDWDCSKKLYMSISTGDSEIIDCENLKDFDIQGFASSENASLNYMTYDRQKKLLTAYYDVRYSSSRMETATVSFYTKNKH